MADLCRLCAYEVLWGRSVFAQLCLIIECFFYIYKYLRPDKPSLLSFIKFPQVSNRYFISCGNFYPYEVDKRSLLFSLPFLKVLKWYFHWKKSYTVKHRLSQHPFIATPVYCNLSLPCIAINSTIFFPLLLVEGVVT